MDRKEPFFVTFNPFLMSEKYLTFQMEKFTFLKGMLTLVTTPGRSHTARK